MRSTVWLLAAFNDNRFFLGYNRYQEHVTVNCTRSNFSNHSDHGKQKGFTFLILKVTHHILASYYSFDVLYFLLDFQKDLYFCTICTLKNKKLFMVPIKNVTGLVI